MTSLKHVKIFADGADLDGILALYKNPSIKGFTTNPTLMRKAGITDYEAFARQIVAAIPDRPISFEVFADDFDEMIAQGRVIASWGDNVYVKIPVTNTKGAFTGPLVRTLASAGVIVQRHRDHDRRAGASGVAECLAPHVPAIVSVFAGRIADTGRDPVPLMRAALRALAAPPESRAALGQPARAAEHLPGRRDRLPHHHRQPRRAQEAVAGRQGPRRLFAGHREDVPPRRHRGRLHHRDAGAQAAS